MAKLYNLARMTTATTGTGTITLGAAVTSWLSFANAGVQNGDTVTYAIVEGNNREIGRGVYTSSGTTLTRSVLKSTNSNSPISLSGSATVFITASAEDFQGMSTATGNTTASVGQVIICYVGGGSWTLSLPASPATGDYVEAIIDLGATPSNYLTVSGNGHNIYSPAFLTSSSTVRLGIEGQRVLFRYDGSAWRATDQTFDLLLAPRTADFTKLEGTGSSTTMDDVFNGVRLTLTGGNSVSRTALLEKTTPGSTFTMQACLSHQVAFRNYPFVGLYAKDSSSGKIQTFCIASNNAAGNVAAMPVFRTSNWSSITTYVADQATYYGAIHWSPIFFRLVLDATNFTVYVSADGASWVMMEQVSKSSYLPAIDRCGVFFCAYANAGKVTDEKLLVKSFSLA